MKGKGKKDSNKQRNILQRIHASIFFYEIPQKGGEMGILGMFRLFIPQYIFFLNVDDDMSP